MKKDRFKVVTSGKVDMLEMTDEIREKMELEKKSKGGKMLEVEKLEKREKELLKANQELQKRWEEASRYVKQVENQIISNNGAIVEVRNFLKPIKDKNAASLAGEKKKEDKKENKVDKNK